jgi:nucleotide-binding universal stress UspA family protein
VAQYSAWRRTHGLPYPAAKAQKSNTEQPKSTSQKTPPLSGAKAADVATEAQRRVVTKLYLAFFHAVGNIEPIRGGYMAEVYRLTPKLEHATPNDKIAYLRTLDAEVLNMMADLKEAREEARAAGNYHRVGVLTRRMQKFPKMLAHHEELRQRLLNPRAH